MKVLEKADATASLAQYSDDIGEESLIITSNGKPIAAHGSAG